MAPSPRSVFECQRYRSPQQLRQSGLQITPLPGTKPWLAGSPHSPSHRFGYLGSSPKDHPLVGGEDITLSDLAHLPWVLQPRSSPSRQVLDSAFAKSGVSIPPSRVETTSRFATLNLVKHAGMIAMLPSTILS